jgi:hypothetical protein
MRTRAAVEHARLLLDTLRLGGAPDAAELRARWQGARQEALVTLARFEGAELWLARRLKQAGIALAGPAADALDAAATRTRARNLRADAALARALEALAAAHVPCVLLKSSALRQLTARLPLAGARASADVDLLVAEAQGEHALGVLRARGWRPLDYEAQGRIAPTAPAGETGTQRARLAAQPAHHLPSLADETGVAIELHVSTGPNVRPMEAWRRALADSAPITVEGAAGFVPSDSWLLLHALTHALNDADERAAGGLRLRYWLDGAVLLAGGHVRWDLVRERVAAGEAHPAPLARTWLYAAAELAGVAVGMDELGTGDLAPLHLERLLAWRLWVLARHDATSRWGRLLLEEGARAEAGLGAALPWAPLGTTARLRRAVAVAAARARWSAWRISL